MERSRREDVKMWDNLAYEFEATDGEMVEIRSALRVQGRIKNITTDIGERMGSYIYDSKMDFFSDDLGDYLLISGLNQDRPGSYDANFRLKRFMQVSSSQHCVSSRVKSRIESVVTECKSSKGGSD